MILRRSASEGGGTPLFASRLIGDREILREHVTHSRSGSLLEPARSTVSRGVQHVAERAVLPSEIEQLADLEGLLQFASSPRWMRVRLGG